MKTYISTIFAWSFLSFALYIFCLSIPSINAYLELTLICSMYFLYLFYLWLRTKLRPTYLEYLILSVVYVCLIVGLGFLYHIIFIFNRGNKFEEIGLLIIGLLAIISISCSGFYWFIRLVIKIFSK